MSNKTSAPEKCECERLLEFKNFLREVTESSSSAGAGGNNELLRNCMTRNNNETYPISLAELPAELIMAIWLHLQAKHCPRYFQLPLLRAGIAEAELECQNAKECEIACALTASSPPEVDNVEIQYDLIKLQKFVINNLEKLLTRLTDNAEAANLKNYAEAQSLCTAEPCICVEQQTNDNTTPAYVAACIKNKPRKMEDRHVCLERFSDLYQLHDCHYSFYGVFDGHSGPLAASYASTHLPYALAAQLRQHDNDDVSSMQREAFESAFLQVDEVFARKRISSGTTAVCALIKHKQQTTAPLTALTASHLFVAWVGDSKALLVSPTASLQLVKPHKPHSPEERKRIESSGGTVMYIQGQWRVNAILNVGRSIGDFSVGAAVIAEPDFVDVTLTKAHDFLVMGTDGLWDHVPETKIVETVYAALAESQQKTEDIPKSLIELAKQGDSQDNITVVIVFLKQRCEIVENYKKVCKQ